MEYVEYVEYVECVECVEYVEYHQSGTVCDGESVEKGVGCFDFGNSSRGVLGGYMRVMRVCMIVIGDMSHIGYVEYVVNMS